MNHEPNLLSRKLLNFIHSFWFKLFVIMALISILSVGILGGIIVLINGPSITKELQKQSHLIAKLVRSLNLSIYYENRDFAKIQNNLQYARERDQANIIYIFLKDPEGKILAQVPENITLANTANGQLDTANPLLQGNAVTHQNLTLTLGAERTSVLDTAIWVLSTQQQGELHIGIRSGVEAALYKNLAGMIGIVFLLLTLGALILRRVVKSQFTRPVNQLVQHIKQIGQGDMQHTIALTVGNELVGLAEGLQEMVEKLKGMVQTESDINRMQGQIMNMLSTVSAAADGNLTVEAEVTADALGSLADAFNMMVASLASIVEQVRNSSNDIGTATNEILISSAQMIKGAEEQGTHINNITSAVDEIAVSMQQVANNAEAAARASQKATEAAQKGEQSVEETIRGMHRIRNTVQATSKKIKSLGDRSIEIEEIVTTIDDIARQTTILALNAAIEAARAGEHGRGFGVVAEEVRKLAERSSKATQDIADLIKGIQAETNEAVRTMEEGTREVEEGTQLADIAGSSLKEIDKSVGQVADLIQEISLAAKQQARGTDGVVKSMETISDITNFHVEGVRKTTETIERLATLSDRLTEAIGNFKIRESQAKAEAPLRQSLAPQPQPQLPPPPRPQPARPQPPRPQPPRPQPQAVPFTPEPSPAPVFGSQTNEEEEELITEEDFFKTS